LPVKYGKRFDEALVIATELVTSLALLPQRIRVRLQLSVKEEDSSLVPVKNRQLNLISKHSF
jgi:hypothetical protein